MNYTNVFSYFSYNNREVFYSYQNNGIQKGYDEDCYRQSFVPMVAVLEWKVKNEKWKVGEGIVGDGDGYDMEADDDEGANGNICYHRKSDAIENLAAIKNSEEEKYIGRVEQDDM